MSPTFCFTETLPPSLCLFAPSFWTTRIPWNTSFLLDHVLFLLPSYNHLLVYFSLSSNGSLFSLSGFLFYNSYHVTRNSVPLNKFFKYVLLFFFPLSIKSVNKIHSYWNLFIKFFSCNFQIQSFVIVFPLYLGI